MHYAPMTASRVKLNASDVSALVVGGASLLGIHLAAALKGAGADVVVADRLAMLVVCNV